MEDPFGGMFKITGSNYSVWKSKMRDMLVVKDLWLSVQFGDGRPDKIDALTWEVMHLKTTTYIWCFIDMSLYNNFNEEKKAHELWEKIGIMLENKNIVNRVSVFRKIVRLRYQAHECLPGVDKSDHLAGSTSSRWGTCIVVARIPYGYLGDTRCYNG